MSAKEEQFSFNHAAPIKARREKSQILTNN